MKKYIKFIMIVGLMLGLGSFPAVALAQGPGLARNEGVRVHFGSNLTLEDGDSIEGGAIVFGGNFTMKEGSEVEGDVVVFGGNVKIDGEVEGDVATLGGNVSIKEHAVIDGDVTSIGGNVRVSEKAEVSGVVADGLQIEIDRQDIVIPTIPTINIPEVPLRPEISIPLSGLPDRDLVYEGYARPGFVARFGQFVGDGVRDVFLALIVAGLSVLIVLFFPTNVQTVQATLNRATPVSFAVGLVTIAAILATTFLLGILFWLIVPICGIFLVALVAAVGWLGGWAVIGRYLGNKIFARFDNPVPNEISATFLGVGVLTLMARMPFVDHLPLIGWMFTLVGFLVFLLISSTGLGAIVLTRFGTQAYQPGAGTAASPLVRADDRVEDGENDEDIKTEDDWAE